MKPLDNNEKTKAARRVAKCLLQEGIVIRHTQALKLIRAALGTEDEREFTRALEERRVYLGVEDV